jgi:2-polyprenyl-6-hydroxyphenyl methylase/3-demethylubiquinone-9 3-methyltransferase
VLDAGCGNGYLAGLIVQEGHEVVGVDASKTGIHVARVACPLARFEYLSLKEDLKERLGVFDMVVSTEVVEHLYDPRRFARNLYGVLDRGGVVILSTPYHGYLKNLAVAAVGAFDRHATALWDGGHIKFWSRSTIQVLLRECGFEPLDFVGVGRAAYLWKSMIIVAQKADRRGE